MIPGMLYIPPPWLDPVYFLSSLVWTLIRSFVTFMVCLVLGITGLKLLDKMTPAISELRTIRGHAPSTALFSAGIFIFAALTVVGSVTAPLPIGFSSGLGQAVNPAIVLIYRLITLLAGFLISILFMFIIIRVLTRLEPFGIDLDNIHKEPVSNGIYVMGYLVFLGIILYAALLLPV